MNVSSGDDELLRFLRTAAFDDEEAPELCKHDDPTHCTEECKKKAEAFDEWMRRKLRQEK